MIQVEHLTKYYGDFLAVEDLSFEIGEKAVYGFLGPNGAGKSTTMNIMTGCLSPSAGSVKICGHDILEEPEAAKRCLGYLPELPPLYVNETPLEYLKFVGEAKGLRGSELWMQIDEVIEKTKIDSVKNRLISALSKGYRQRVGIAQALLGNPQVIILDEPTVGLDPLQIIEIRELISSLGQEHTVILSSHILSEVQAVCSKVLIIAKGKLLAFDTPEKLETVLHSSNEIVFSAEAAMPEAERILQEIPSISDWQIVPAEGGIRVNAHTESGESKDICRAISLAFAQQGFPIFEMNSKKASLEDVFIELTESAEEKAEPQEEAPKEEEEE